MITTLQTFSPYLPISLSERMGRGDGCLFCLPSQWLSASSCEFTAAAGAAAGAASACVDSLEVHILAGAQIDSCVRPLDYLIYWGMSTQTHHLHIGQSGPWTVSLHFITGWKSPVWWQTSDNSMFFALLDLKKEKKKRFRATDFSFVLIKFMCITVHLLSLCMLAQITHRFITQLTTGPLPLPPSPPYVWRAPALSPATQTVAVWACVSVCVYVVGKWSRMPHLVFLLSHSSLTSRSMQMLPVLLVFTFTCTDSAAASALCFALTRSS